MADLNDAGEKSQENYRQIGGGSPLRRITDEQAQALQSNLQQKGQDAAVYVGMRYWHPFTEEAVARIKRDHIDRLVILPLYPHFSISTSGSSFRLLEKIWNEDPSLQQIEYTVIPSWYDRPGYLRAMAQLIAQELDQFPNPNQVHVFFSAHGVPVSYVEEAGILSAGDRRLRQVDYDDARSTQPLHACLSKSSGSSGMAATLHRRRPSKAG